MEDKGSGSEQSVTNYKKQNTNPCRICKTNEDDDDVIKCYKPPWWLCQACRTFPGVVEVKPDDDEDSNEMTAGLPNDSVSSRSSRVDGHNSGNEHSGNETSATDQSSQSEAHTTSPEASINTSPEQKQSDSYTQSDNETSATNQPSQSQAHTTSAEVSTDTSPEQKQADSKTPSDAKSSK